MRTVLLVLLLLASCAVPPADVPGPEDIKVLQQQFEQLKQERDEALDQRDKLFEMVQKLRVATNCA